VQRGQGRVLDMGHPWPETFVVDIPADLFLKGHQPQLLPQFVLFSGNERQSLEMFLHVAKLFAMPFTVHPHSGQQSASTYLYRNRWEPASLPRSPPVHSPS
jgi:hypothetical protein